MNTEWLKNIYKQIKEEKILPDNFKLIDFKHQYYDLFYHYVALIENKTRNRPLISGVQGPIGIGKTTMVKIIKRMLESQGYNVAAFSIDDFYLSLSKRRELSLQHSENPYYKIPRGMPGTHDIAGLESVLQSARNQESFSVPIFDKSLHNGQGDVSLNTLSVPANIDLVILEGWCIGLSNVSTDNFTQTIYQHPQVKEIFNEIDAEERHHKRVFSYAKDYKSVWNQLDHLIQLKPADHLDVFEWRVDQEENLKQHAGQGMGQAETVHFLKHFIPFLYFISKWSDSKYKWDRVLKVGKDRRFL